MNKVFSFLFVFVVFGIVSFYVLKNFLPNLLPPAKTIKQYFPLGADTLSPIRIQNGLKMNLFYDLRGELPTKLEYFDGSLFAIITNTKKIVAIINNKKIDLVTGMKKPLDFAFDGPNLYVLDNNIVYTYLYNTETFTVSSKVVFMNFNEVKSFMPIKIKVQEGNIYLSDGNSIQIFGLKDKLDKTNEILAKADTFFEMDNQNHVFSVDDNQIVKFDFFAGNITDKVTILSGFTQSKGVSLGMLGDIAFDEYGNMYVSDQQTGLIYVVYE